MKKYFALLFIILSCFEAHSARGLFKQEVIDGLDIATIRAGHEPAHGELGGSVYDGVNSDTADNALFIPTSMYVRGGAVYNLGFLSSDVHKMGIDGGLGALVGLGFEMSSYVRTEFDFGAQNFVFEKKDEAFGDVKELGANVYFDFARRWVRSGDITKRRSFVPFMGVGWGLGHYDFTGAGGRDGVYTAPRFALGLNFAFSEFIGLDVMYRYKIAIGSPLGSVSDISASIRASF